ncbi:hypothetical protein KUF57_12420 [Mycolicibacterium sp. PAM1]|nr:hypothetical protein [Mycolicibacterium sp. PAM1]MBV5244339.1 hypothetical protein [Mycolicibacterium sp. PAM1]
MSGQHITNEDLRRAARLVVSIYENDVDTTRRASEEAHRLRRWAETALGCALVARVVLTKVDEAEDDEGSIALWLHAAVEQITDGDAVGCAAMARPAAAMSTCCRCPVLRWLSESQPARRPGPNCAPPASPQDESSEHRQHSRPWSLLIPPIPMSERTIHAT